jgi:protein-tyrosine-phosphatase
MTSRLQAARYRRAHLPRLVRCLQHAQRVLFVCHGNIMRSPFASAYYSRRNLEIPRRGPAMSAGLHASPGRTADPRAVDAGRAWGLDLSSHHSRLLDNDLLGWADVILVMDRTNLRAVQRLYPTAAHKTYLLGALDISCGADADLADPYSASPHATDTVCRRIAACIDRLLEHMQMAPPDAMHEAEAAGLSRPRDALRLPGSKTA